MKPGKRIATNKVVGSGGGNFSATPNGVREMKEAAAAHEKDTEEKNLSEDMPRLRAGKRSSHHNENHPSQLW